MEKDTRKLEYLIQIRKVLFFIERNLDEDLSLEQLAKVGCFSMYHFHRIFHGVIGETPSAYVRRLRLERAAGQLAYSDTQVTDIALDASYNKPSAFNKAFKKVMGCSPTQYREMPPINHQKQDNFNMKANINVLEETSVLSVRKTGSYPKSAPAAWNTLKEFLDKHELRTEGMRFIGVYHDNPDITAEENIRSEACCTVPLSIAEEGEIVRKVIEGGRYATFEHKGPLNELGKTFDGIFPIGIPKAAKNLENVPVCWSFQNYQNKVTIPNLKPKSIFH